MKVPLMKDRQRFWSKVNIGRREDCWEWQAALNHSGYGSFKYCGMMHGAHRISWWFYYNQVPPLLVLHKCDNPKCVNPNHLFLGSTQDNVADRVAKNRTRSGWVPGEKNGRAKLTTENVLEIRKRLAEGERNVNLSYEYGVSKSVISSIKRKKTWRHIDA